MNRYRLLLLGLAVLLASDATLQQTDETLRHARARLVPGGMVVLPPRVFVGGAECLNATPVALVPAAFLRALAQAHGLVAEEADGVLMLRRPV